MTDDEIVARIAKMIRDMLVNLDDGYSRSIEATHILDCAEAYRLAFVGCVRERAKIRREQKRVSKLVFAELRLHDRRVVEK